MIGAVFLLNLLALFGGVFAVFPDEIGVKDWSYKLVGPVKEEHLKVVHDSNLLLAYSDDTHTLGLIDVIDGSTLWRTEIPVDYDLLSFDLLSNGNQVALVSVQQKSLYPILQVWNVKTNILLLNLYNLEKLSAVGDGNKFAFSNVLQSASDDSLYFAVQNRVWKCSLDGKVWSIDLSKDTFVRLLRQSGSNLEAFGSISGNPSLIRIETSAGKLGKVESVGGDISEKTLIRAIKDSVYWLSDDNTLHSYPTDSKIRLSIDKSDRFLAIEDAGDEKKIAVKSLLKSFVIAGVKVSAETDHTVPLLGQTEDLKVSLKSANLKLSREYRIWEKEIVGGVGSVHVVKSSSRLLIVQKSGDLLSLNVDDGKFLWIRPESLSSAKFAVAVELPERILLEDNHEDILQTGSRGVFEAFKSRWSDHLRSLFVGPSQAYSVPEALLKDKFGMHQLVVVGSANSGMVYAFDTQFKGKIVWQLDAKGSVKFIDILRGVESRQTPQLVVISEQQQDQQKKFLAYVVNALDGTVVKAAKEFSGDFLGAFHLNPLDHSVAVVNDKLEIKHFPEPSAAVNAKQDNYRTVVFAAKDQKSIEGYSLQLSDTVPLKLRWTFKLAVGEQLVVVGKRSRGDVASSIGRALGDRSVLYKYLNPNIMSVLTWDSVSSGEQMTTLHLTIIDSISGNVVMREKIPNVLMNKDLISVAHSENAVAVSYWKFTERFKKVETDKKKIIYDISQALTSIEIYLDDKKMHLSTILASRMSSFNLTHTSSLSQTYQLPIGIQTMQFTKSLNGITTKDLIIAGSDGDVKFIPRKLIDPRRPYKTAAQMSAEEKEEELIPYEPVLTLDQKSSLAYNLNIQVKQVLTFPSALESTVLVFAYGGRDLFFTSHAPSKKFDQLGDDFSKNTLITIITALIAAIFVARYIALNKRFQQSWK